MPIIFIMLGSFVAGLFTITIISLYKWVFEVWAKGLK
jgi:hypothetical protein